MRLAYFAGIRGEEVESIQVLACASTAVQRVNSGDANHRSGASSQSGTFPQLQLLLLSLTFITGMVDAVTYLDVGHVFVANMTGNFVLLGLGFLRVDGLGLTASLIAVTGFVIGTAAGGHLSQSLEAQGSRWLLTALRINICLLLLAVLAAAYRPMLGDYPTIVLLACAMGLTNATANRIGIPGLTTTIVITNTLTNLVSGMLLLHGDSATRVRQASAVAALVLGAVVGGGLLLWFEAVAVIGAAAAIALIATAAYGITLPKTTAEASLDRAGARVPGSAPAVPPSRPKQGGSLA
jgi:uncharacterized membrane protein YoaK (UPF0700 family)